MSRSPTILELVTSAQINFENLEKMFPQVKNEPLYVLAKMQLDDGVEALQEEVRHSGLTFLRSEDAR